LVHAASVGKPAFARDLSAVAFAKAEASEVCPASPTWAKPGRSRELRLASHPSFLRDTEFHEIGAVTDAIGCWPLGRELLEAMS
jgi:hypothetical protein